MDPSRGIYAFSYWVNWGDTFSLTVLQRWPTCKRRGVNICQKDKCGGENQTKVAENTTL